MELASKQGSMSVAWAGALLMFGLPLGHVVPAFVLLSGVREGAFRLLLVCLFTFALRRTGGAALTLGSCFLPGTLWTPISLPLVAAVSS